MNFVEKLKADLEDNGMFPDQVDAVMAIFLEDNNKSSMGKRVYEDVDAYPEMLYNVLWATCKTFALKYIDENCPKAWFRPIFLPLNEQDEFLKSAGYIEKVLEKDAIQPDIEADQTKLYIIKSKNTKRYWQGIAHGWYPSRKTAAVFPSKAAAKSEIEYMRNERVCPDKVCIEPKKWPARIRRFNYAHFPVGTICKVLVQGPTDIPIVSETEVTVTGVYRNGPDSYGIRTNYPGTVTEFFSCNINHVKSIVKRGIGEASLNNTVHSIYFAKHVFNEPCDIVSKHRSQYASFDARGLVCSVSSKYINDDMLVDNDALCNYLFSIGCLQRCYVDKSAYTYYTRANKKKLNNAIKRCINKFCMSHAKEQQLEDDSIINYLEDDFDREFNASIEDNDSVLDDPFSNQWRESMNREYGTEAVTIALETGEAP